MLAGTVLAGGGAERDRLVADHGAARQEPLERGRAHTLARSQGEHGAGGGVDHDERVIGAEHDDAVGHRLDHRLEHGCRVRHTHPSPWTPRPWNDHECTAL
ncbi:MAG: hypothetical protein R2755_09435 [Acidimicrobiales bacterium]